MKTHTLKTINPHFSLVWSGLKTFELRKNDRDYRVGDHLTLEEFNDENEQYSGAKIFCQISHILEGGQYGLAPEYCVLSIKIIGKKPTYARRG